MCLQLLEQFICSQNANRPGGTMMDISYKKVKSQGAASGTRNASSSSHLLVPGVFINVGTTTFT
jgi:hypothetical protein